MGRPSSFTTDISQRICDQLADGKSLRSICLAEDMPCTATVMNWLLQGEKEVEGGQFRTFLEHYAQARDSQAEYYADEVVDIADGSKAEDVQQARLRIDARKWIAGKLKPKKYGDKFVQELTGKDGGPIQTESPSELEIARKIAFLLASGAQQTK